MKKIKRTLAIILTLAMAIPMITVPNVKTKAVDTTVTLDNWTFVQGGQFVKTPYHTELWHVAYINSVTMEETNEVIDEWLKGNDSIVNAEDDPSVNQEITAQTISTGFALDIANNSQDKDWSNDRINPWAIRAEMREVDIEAGHTYTVSFDAYASKKKYCYVAFGCDIEGVSPYGEDDVKGSNQLIALSTQPQKFTYTFTNWVSAEELSVKLMLGAFNSQYDYYGNDVSDIINPVESMWGGVVYVSNFTITDNDMNSNYVPEPEPPTVPPTTPDDEDIEVEPGGNAAANKSWSSFSICTREDGGMWEDALKQTPVYDENGYFLRYNTKGLDYATEGWITPEYDSNMPAETVNGGFRYYARNTGWDAAYDPNYNLVADNPWGMTATMKGISVDNGRTYAISFKIKSSIKNSNTTIKHIILTAGDGASKINFSATMGCTTGGYITLDSSSDEWKTVTATVTIPSSKDEYSSDTMDIQFALGSMIYTYPDEVAMSGSYYVKDFQVIAGEKPYTVTYMDDETVVAQKAVLSGEKVDIINRTKEGYELVGYKNSETGELYDFDSTVTSDLVLEAVWEPIKYQVVFRDEGRAVSIQSVAYGTAAIAPELEKEGYTLTWDKTFDNITKELEVNAIWTFNKYNVVFKDGDLVLKEQEVYHGYGAIAPEVAKEGYILSWDKSFDNVTEDLEINAVWTINSYKVIFKDGDIVLKEQEVYYGYAAVAPELAKDGYTLSWDKSFNKITGDITVNAVWTPKEVETTTVKDEKPTETTTVKQETPTDEVKVAKAKIKKATKAKASKKAKISLKKITGASGYQVQISKKKNFKTVLVKKNVKKVSFSISSKKIKKLKKIYVRARAFVKKNGKKHYGAWSKVKKVKIK